MCHSLNYYSVVENGPAAISLSLLLRNKILRTSTKSNIVAKTASSRKRKFSYYGAVFYIDRSLFQIIWLFFSEEGLTINYCSLGYTVSKLRNNHFPNLNNKS